MAGTTTTLERRRATPENQAIRQTIDALEYAAELPPDRKEDTREMLRRAHEEAIATLRGSPSRPMAMLEMKVAPLPALIIAASFLLGLGIGLSFGGST